MEIQQLTSEDKWLEARFGKITGTKAGNLMLKNGKGKKMGYYEILAERVAIPASEESAMDRGHRLENDAIQRFDKESGKTTNTNLVMWSRSDFSDIAVSPDGYIGKTEAVEVKCLSSARHIEAWLTKKIPSEYETQVLQYFVVNDKLKTLHFVFYDPRIPIDFFWIDVERKDIKDKIKEQFEFEKSILLELEEDEKLLTF